MKLLRSGLVVAVGLLLAAAMVAYFATRGPGGQPTPARPAVAAQTPLVDDSMLRTARQVSALADTPEEQDQAREALRLSDHELDQAYATALRQAEAVPPPTSGPLHEITARIAQLKTRVAADQARIDDLTKQAATSETAAEQVELVKARQALDQDELEDAQEDLTRQGGDRHATLEQALQQHEATQHQPPVPFKTAGNQAPPTLVQQVQLWLELNDRDRQLLEARAQAAAKASALLAQHQKLDAQTGPASAASGDAAASVSRLRNLSNQTKTLSEYDKRIQDTRQLSDVYSRWSALVQSRRTAVLHLMLGSLAIVLAVVLAVILIDRAISRAFAQADRRRLHQMRAVAKLAVQATGALIVLLVAFGPPTQIGTLIGLATAGLTVALKDFIVGFLGWFVLLGRNGLHIGDWVEIEGVSGEVIEIGLLKTVLLEVGNWTAMGHPTGRRVSFVNSFAIEGHFFNFSTVGQWLWDQIQVTVPAASDPYSVAAQIAEVVGRETETAAREAEQDWRRVTTQYGVREFSAKPAVDLRPGAAGLDVVVRYITRAPERFEVKSRLFQAIVGLLHQSAPASQHEASLKSSP